MVIKSLSIFFQEIIFSFDQGHSFKEVIPKQIRAIAKIIFAQKKFNTILKKHLKYFIFINHMIIARHLLIIKIIYFKISASIYSFIWLCVYFFSKENPNFKFKSKIIFHKPISFKSRKFCCSCKIKQKNAIRLYYCMMN